MCIVHYTQCNVTPKNFLLSRVTYSRESLELTPDLYKINIYSKPNMFQVLVFKTSTEWKFPSSPKQGAKGYVKNVCVTVGTGKLKLQGTALRLTSFLCFQTMEYPKVNITPGANLGNCNVWIIPGADLLPGEVRLSTRYCCATADSISMLGTFFLGRRWQNVG
jgi:hypothetical protein